MAGFTKPEDIVNRALQRIGAKRITTLTESSRNATEANACYDKLRRAELRRNVWRFAIRKEALRPIQIYNQSKLPTFVTWASGTSYAVDDIVTGSDGQIYESMVAANLANDPTSTSGFWTLYCGPLVAQEFVCTWGAGFTYAKGDHAVGSDSNVYTSLVAANINHNPVGNGNVQWSLAATVDAKDLTKATTYGVYTGELFFIGATVYLSLQTANTDVPPSAKWLTLTAAPALTVPQFSYPIGSGPLSNSNSRNAFRLPANYLRVAPRDPHAGQYSVMGAPTNISEADWTFESDYIVSSEPALIIFRFVCDASDVTHMDDMFCEGLGSRIALELCEPLTQSAAKLQAIEGEYKQFMGDARTQAGIENGPIETPLDDFLQCRL